MDDFHDRKVALIIRDSLDDDSRQIMAAQHGNGMVHIAWRGEKTGLMTDVEYRSARQPAPGTAKRDRRLFHPTRFGIEKKGDQFQLWVSWQGEPMHPEGAPVTFKTNGPFYVGIGFTSHLPANVVDGEGQRCGAGKCGRHRIVRSGRSFHALQQLQQLRVQIFVGRQHRALGQHLARRRAGR